MKPIINATTQKLLNLYRQQHVIEGGWAAVNQVFMDEANDNILSELAHLPTSALLAQHIHNLRTGKTSMNSIDPELLPYGGMMASKITPAALSDSEFEILQSHIDEFKPNLEYIEKIKSLPLLKKFGTDWESGVKTAISGYPDLVKKWVVIIKTMYAYDALAVAKKLLTSEANDRIKAELQAHLPDFETYLPMFGNTGTDLLIKLRKMIENN